ncbi:hypothetical protein SNEBB_001101 [Seison nebaliae]|nr:hypothetical protein SNEBB_001101 [Seison nebaliae]
MNQSQVNSMIQTDAKALPSVMHSFAMGEGKRRHTISDIRDRCVFKLPPNVYSGSTFTSCTDALFLGPILSPENKCKLTNSAVPDEDSYKTFNPECRQGT